uniref:Ammonium transporter n=1 Tax=Eurythoe complanata TaxID=167815 RepID=A0A1B3PEF7_EURCO|nr:AMT-like ammonia transporter [Eurythoe complanata]
MPNATALEIQLSQMQKEVGTINSNNDTFFLIVMAVIIFFMQCGFAFLESGAVRSKNTTNILLKNMLDCFVCGITYWAAGYALAFGPGNAFLGYRYWFGESMPDDKLAHWFFHFVFAATATTIVSGAVAERCEFVAYIVYSSIITGIVYPIVSHWAWDSQGWLATAVSGVAYQDFAGSGVVHLLGGTAAFVGAVFLGPRLGRFDPVTGKPQAIRGHSVPLAALGGFILMFGFFAFNGGSQASISASGDGVAIARSIVNTIISGSAAALTAMCVKKLALCVGGCGACLCDCGRTRWSLLVTINGALTGMVTACAGCNVMYTWAAAVTGIVAGMIFLGVSALVVRLKVDDPLDAVAVHGGGGLWGVIAAPLFNTQGGLVFSTTGEQLTASGKALGWNLVGALAIIAWSAVICVIMFGILKCCKVLRVNRETEIEGLDKTEHGEPAYPDDINLEPYKVQSDGNLTPVADVVRYPPQNGGRLQHVGASTVYVDNPPVRHHGHANTYMR